MDGGQRTPQQVALRCRIVLATADGQSEAAIAQQLSINRRTVFCGANASPNSAWTDSGRLLWDTDANRTTTALRSPPLWTQPCRPDPKA
jgi:hypothetical protein